MNTIPFTHLFLHPTPIMDTRANRAASHKALHAESTDPGVSSFLKHSYSTGLDLTAAVK